MCHHQIPLNVAAHPGDSLEKYSHVIIPGIQISPYKRLSPFSRAESSHKPLCPGCYCCLSVLFFLTHACPSQFSLPLYLNLLPLCTLRHSAIQCWCQIQRPESPTPASVTDLLQRVAQHEDTLMEGMRKALENPPPSVSDVSESMEDLGMDQGDLGCKEADCCRRQGDMDLDAPDQPQNLCSSSRNGCSNLGESINLLLQCCMDIVVELGLPQELIQHLQQLKSTEWILCDGEPSGSGFTQVQWKYVPLECEVKQVTDLDIYTKLWYIICRIRFCNIIFIIT